MRTYLGGAAHWTFSQHWVTVWASVSAAADWVDNNIRANGSSRFPGPNYGAHDTESPRWAPLFPPIETRKVRLRRTECLVQGHTACWGVGRVQEWGRLALNPVFLLSASRGLPILILGARAPPAGQSSPAAQPPPCRWRPEQVGPCEGRRGCSLGAHQGGLGAHHGGVGGQQARIKS